MNKREYNLAWRADKIARGLCTKCGVESAVPNRRLCTNCFEKLRPIDCEKHLAAYRGAKANGMCVNCRVVAARVGFTRCQECAVRGALYSKRSKNKALAAGLCARCFVAPRFGKMTLCLYCADLKRARFLGIKAKVFEHYGRQCAQCSEGRAGCLSIDHVNDDGATHRKNKSVGGGWKFYRWLVVQGFPEGYQTLCMNCQFIKEAERRERMRQAGTPILRGALGVNGPPQRRRVA